MINFNQLMQIEGFLRIVSSEKNRDAIREAARMVARNKEDRKIEGIVNVTDKARLMLYKMGIDEALNWSSGNLLELENLISDKIHLENELDRIKNEHEALKDFARVLINEWERYDNGAIEYDKILNLYRRAKNEYGIGVIK